MTCKKCGGNISLAMQQNFKGGTPTTFCENCGGIRGHKPEDIIVCLVGESCCGKTTLAKLLSKDYNVIQSYTTRPPREENEWGHTFVDANSFLDTDSETLIAYNNYHGNHYWATKEQYQGKGITIYVVDPPGIEDLKKTVKDAKIIVVYLNCDAELRFDRLLHRTEGDFEEVCNRMSNDIDVFQFLSCDYVINVNELPPKEVKDIFLPLILTKREVV